jgi:hypothetical protein
MVAVKGPTQTTDADYLHSVVLSAAALRQRLAGFTPPAGTTSTASIAVSRGVHSQPILPMPANSRRQVAHPARDRRHPLPNRDLDTGRVVQPGGYSLTDSTYAQLLHSLTRNPAQPIPPGIKEDIQAYYDNPASPITTKKNPSAWAQVQADLATLSAMPASTEQESYPTYGDDTDSAQ